MIFVDSDVFLIDLRYPRDERFAENRIFLERLQASERGATAIFNLLEVCGVLSFNLNRQQLWELFHYFPRRYSVEIIPSHLLDRRLPTFAVRTVLGIMERRASFGDTLILGFLRRRRDIDLIVSWNAPHFEGRIGVQAVLPPNAMDQL